MPRVFITDPPSGTELDYSKAITIHWDSDPPGAITRWKFYLGTENGRWDLLMCEREALKKIDLDPHDLPPAGRLYAQVRGVYSGSCIGEKGEEQGMNERVLSDTVEWICPEKTLVATSL